MDILVINHVALRRVYAFPRFEKDEMKLQLLSRPLSYKARISFTYTKVDRFNVYVPSVK